MQTDWSVLWRSWSPDDRALGYPTHDPHERRSRMPGSSGRHRQGVVEDLAALPKNQRASGLSS